MAFSLFCLWTFVIVGRPQDLIPALAAIRPALVLSIVTVMTVFGGSMPSVIEAVRNAPEARRNLIFFGIMTLGIPFAYHRGEAFDFVMNAYLPNLLHLLVFVTLVDSVARLKKILWVVTLCGTVYGVFGLLKGSSMGERFIIYGMMFDPNDIAYVLVSLLPIMLFFVVQREGLGRKFIALAGVGSSLLLILLTGSRAGVLSLTTVVVLLLFTPAGSIKFRYRFVFIAAITLIAFLNLEDININRYLTLMRIEEDYNYTAEDGRVGIWEKAYELLLRNPVTGVGANCFPMAIGYLRKAIGEIPRWQAVHNSYLQIAVEIGVAGFAVFILLIAGSLRTFFSARKNQMSRSDEDQLNAISGSLLVGFVGSLIAAFFLSQGYSVYFTLYFAFSAVIRRLVSQAVVPVNVPLAHAIESCPVTLPSAIGRGHPAH